MGNSEVGHMNIGAGRVVMQDLPRIDAAVADGTLAKNAALKKLISDLVASGGTCHLMGLLSPGGVHAHQDHMAALARIVAQAGVPVAVHALLDGRDTPPASALGYVTRFKAAIAGGGDIRIGTVCGRYWAMDRDKRWDRVARAFAAIVSAEAPHHADGTKAGIQARYDAGESDEFVEPIVIGGYGGMADGDGLLMANFRADRSREILTAMLDPAFDEFPRARLPKLVRAVGLCEYSSALNAFVDTVFPPQAVPKSLGEVVAAAGLKQLRIAETEKYAHVTFFLNGGEEEPFTGEERILIPSPDVATYDLKPEMAAIEVTDALVAAIRESSFDLVVVNFANTDMVGHTGDLKAAISAVETIDHCLSRLLQAVEEAGGALFVTADHGNAEQMRDPSSGGPHTAHTHNPVPAVLAGAIPKGTKLHDGRLSDIAPTLLGLMGLAIPSEMTGADLIDSPREVKAHAAVG
jgi:2,3-bisphosphoglycerate-independent phosphoglycerate mutase